MSDREYEILDELYFLISFDQLLEKLEDDEQVLKEDLKNLIQKGWIRALEKNTENPVEDLDSFNKNYKFYNYLASKAGLFAHNSR